MEADENEDAVGGSVGMSLPAPPTLRQAYPDPPPAMPVPLPFALPVPLPSASAPLPGSAVPFHPLPMGFSGTVPGVGCPALPATIPDPYSVPILGSAVPSHPPPTGLGGTVPGVVCATGPPIPPPLLPAYQSIDSDDGRQAPSPPPPPWPQQLDPDGFSRV